MRTHARLYADMRDTCIHVLATYARTHARTHTWSSLARGIHGERGKKNQWRRTLDANKARDLKNTCSLRPQPLAA